MSSGSHLTRSTCLVLTVEMCQLPNHLQYFGSHLLCERGKLCPVGNRRLHLQLLHSEETFFVVDQVQLYVYHQT
jgi:hypothetical protein